MKKKFGLIAVLSTAAQWLFAQCAGVIVGILIIIVGLVIIVKLLEVIIKVLPPGSSGSTTNTVTQFIVVDDEIPPALNIITNAPQETPKQPARITFPVQYGVSSIDGLPWVATGTNVVSQTNTCCGVVYYFENDDSSCDFVYCYGGNLCRITSDNNAMTVNTKPLNVVLESSPDLQNWTPILTNNACLLDGAYELDDTNSQSSANFYRVFYQ